MILKTQRLLITELTIQDAPFFFELVNDKDWKRFIGDREIYTIQDAENYLTGRIIPSYTNWGFGFYLVSDLNTKTPLGISGFVDREGLDFVDVGFAFLPSGRNKGYAYESTDALVSYGKENLNFDTILAIANNDNQRSHHLLKKLGFRFDKFVKLHDEDQEISLFTNQ
tara:strand:+ start:3336 stop:3839 length:504 start_codon:yes stop_codon:yes gene_type:complete